jgi:hypothetical protein
MDLLALLMPTQMPFNTLPLLFIQTGFLMMESLPGVILHTLSTYAQSQFTKSQRVLFTKTQNLTLYFRNFVYVPSTVLGHSKADSHA